MSEPPELSWFKRCLPLTLAQERRVANAAWGDPRNFSDDRHDRGGATQDGIIQREYDGWRKRHGLPVQSVKLIGAAEGEDIYDSEYWLPYCALMPPGLNLNFFDASVNEGTHEAILILQFALGIPRDGRWGPQTEAAVKGIVDLDHAIEAFTERRAAVYRLMPDDRYFDKDWQRRTREIGDAALQMAAELRGGAPGQKPIAAAVHDNAPLNPAAAPRPTPFITPATHRDVLLAQFDAFAVRVREFLSLGS